MSSPVEAMFPVRTRWDRDTPIEHEQEGTVFFPFISLLCMVMPM